MPSSINGTVIGVEVFTRDGMEKDERTQSIEADHLSVAKKDSDDQIKIINDATRIRLIDLIKGSKISKANGLKRGSTASLDDLSEMNLDDLLSIRTSDDNTNNKIESAEIALKEYIKDIQEKIGRAHV